MSDEKAVVDIEFQITAEQKDKELLPCMTDFAKFISKSTGGFDDEQGALMYQSTLEVMEEAIKTRGADDLLLNRYQLAAIHTAQRATQFLNILGTLDDKVKGTGV